MFRVRQFLNIGQLEQFVTIAREGSFGRAAKSLALSQPTLTRSIRALEADVGVRLFDRGARGTVLTLAGQRLLPRAEALINDAERIVAGIDQGGSPDAQVRIGISPNFYFDLLEGAIGERIRANGRINFQVTAGTREMIVEDLRRNAIDFGVCLLPDFFYTAGVEGADIMFEPLGEEVIAPYVAADHPAAGATSLAEVADCRWAVPHYLSVSYRFESAFYRNSLPVPLQAVNTTSLGFLRGLALNQGLVVLLPQRMAQRDVDTGALCALQIAALQFNSLSGLMMRKGRGLSPEAEALAGHLRHAFASTQESPAAG